jgi:hypothetical protein
MYSNSSSSSSTTRSGSAAAAAAAAAAVPEPVQAYVTRWAADPYSRGAYSYYAVGNPKNITGDHIRSHFSSAAVVSVTVRDISVPLESLLTIYLVASTYC